MKINQVYNENCLDTMRNMPEGFIDLTVTSPPYDNLRDYKGYSFPFEEIAKELYRVTKPGGVVVWVVGDQTVNGSESGTSFRQALYFMECGFLLGDTMIYAQPGTGAKGSIYFYWQGFEYMFILTKGKIKTSNRIRDKKNLKYGQSKERGSSPKMDRLKTRQDRKGIKPAPFSYRTNVWTINNGHGHSDYTEHPAPFPEKLAKDHIISWSNEGDLVYDPFMGSGTTAKMAILKKRNFIGSEVAKEYIPIIQRRVRDAREAMKQGNLFDQL